MISKVRHKYTRVHQRFFSYEYTMMHTRMSKICFILIENFVRCFRTNLCTCTYPDIQIYAKMHTNGFLRMRIYVCALRQVAAAGHCREPVASASCPAARALCVPRGRPLREHTGRLRTRARAHPFFFILSTCSHMMDFSNKWS